MTLTAGPRDLVIAATTNWNGSMQAFDSAGRRRWTVENQRDVALPAVIGWKKGGEMWIADPWYSQIALVNEFGAVTKSLELPSWVRPTFAQRKTFPVFGEMNVFALFEDGSMLVIPRQAHSILGASGYDETMSYLLKVSESGLIQKTIAKFPSLEYARSGKGDRGPKVEQPKFGRYVPSFFWPRLRVAADGMRSVVVTIDTIAPAADTVVVSSYDQNGAVVYSRKIGYPSRRYTDQEIDSLMIQRFPRLSAEERDYRGKLTSRRAPPVLDLMLGRDYSVWIVLRETATARPVVGFDASGQPLGTLYCPLTVALKAADRGRIWGIDAKSRVGYRYVLGKS